jgi:cathepsin D
VGSTTSGLLGLGFQGVTGAGERPWWIQAMDQWDDKRFGIYLERTSWGDLPPGTEGNQTTGLQHTAGGTLTLGGVAEELYTGEINYVPVTEEKYWMVDFDGAKVNGKALAPQGKRAILDTGSTLNFFPPEYAAEFFAQIPGAIKAPELGWGMWAVPCKTDVKIQYTFGGVDYDIFPDDFNFGIHDAEKGTCVSQIVAQTPGSNAEFLFGAAFMKNVYTVHRPQPAAVGFAKLVNQGTPYNGWPEYKGNGTTPEPAPEPQVNSSTSAVPSSATSSAEATPSAEPTPSVAPVPSADSSAIPVPSASGNVTLPDTNTLPNTGRTEDCGPNNEAPTEPYWNKMGRLEWRKVAKGHKLGKHN